MTRHIVSGVVVAAILLSVADDADAQLRDVQTMTLTASDGTSFEVTSAGVRVPEQRTVAGSGRTIDLAVVRLRRTGAQATASATQAMRRSAVVIAPLDPQDGHQRPRDAGCFQPRSA